MSHEVCLVPEVFRATASYQCNLDRLSRPPRFIHFWLMPSCIKSLSPEIPLAPESKISLSQFPAQRLAQRFLSH